MSDDPMAGPEESQGFDPLALCFGIAATLTWSALLFAYLFVVPKYQAIFAELKVDLPLPTKLALALANPTVLAVAALVVVLALVVMFVTKNKSIALAMLAVGLLGSAITYGAIHLPITKVKEALDKQEQSQRIPQRTDDFRCTT